jgi:hypothetical protein
MPRQAIQHAKDAGAALKVFTRKLTGIHLQTSAGQPLAAAALQVIRRDPQPQQLFLRKCLHTMLLQQQQAIAQAARRCHSMMLAVSATDCACTARMTQTTTTNPAIPIAML